MLETVSDTTNSKIDCMSKSIVSEVVPLDPSARNALASFMSSIAPYRAAYTESASLSFLATRSEGGLSLIKGRLFLARNSREIPKGCIETQSLGAGHFLVSDLYDDLDACICDLLAGALSTPIGNASFLPEDGKAPFLTRMPFHSEGVRAGNRLDLLVVAGMAIRGLIVLPDADWELKAAPAPYDSVAELASEMHLGHWQGDLSTVEVLAQHIADVDFLSVVEGEDAFPAAFLAYGLDPELVSFGYRTFLAGKVVGRGSITGKQMVWGRREGQHHGRGSLRIPKGAALYCVVSYAGFAQHQGWIADPSILQNAQRAIVEVFDPSLSELQGVLTRATEKIGDARQLEAAVAWLLSMLGFRTVNLGVVPRTQDAVDLILATPMNNFALVECTVGLLKQDKVAQLVARTQVVKGSLERAGHPNRGLLPMMVTLRPREEVRAGAESAERLGVCVVCREEVDLWLQQSRLISDPERIYESLRDSANRATTSIAPRVRIVVASIEQQPRGRR